MSGDDMARPDETGFDPSRWVGSRYSPNLFKWLAKERSRHWSGAPQILRDERGNRWIGWMDSDRWFYGTRLARVLAVGTKAEVFAHPTAPGREEPGFWERYDAIGRCALDEAHTTYFIGSETRWRTAGDTRDCLWCGRHSQKRERYTYTQERERWVPRDSDGSGEAGQTAQQAGPKATARAGGIAETPPALHSQQEGNGNG